MSTDRWKFAQEYELPYQIQKASNTGFVKDIEGQAKTYSRQFEDSLRKFTNLNNNTRILEIGCGPAGLIFFMNTGKRFGIDPLMDHYKKGFNKIVDFTATHCTKGMGEVLPFKNGSFDVAIIHNALDHTAFPSLVLRETRRILKKDGIVYIGINTYSALVYLMSKAYKVFWSIFPAFIKKRIYPPVFRPHPNIMSRKSLLKTLDKAGLKVIYAGSRTAAEAKRAFRQKRKGLFWLIVSTFAYSGGFETVLACRQ